MSLTTLRCTLNGHVATVALARPDKLNALNAAMHAELRETLHRLEQDEAVRTVVLTGEGRAFSAGQDLTEDLPRDEQGRIDLAPPLARDYNPLVLKLANYSKVTIAALNGPAVGASMNIALACDLVVAARSAYLQGGFSRIALIPDAGGTWILPRLVGPKQALALMLTSESVPAEEAQRMGLVYKVFEDSSFADDVAAFAAKLAEGPGLAYRLTKQAVARSLSNDLEAQLTLEAKYQTEAGLSDDFAEGIRAFREKRAPRFEGR
jgi:2-(1,2-epoxy-1,2-dihydrophenyl)acetyl-CoA isomerase